MKTRNRPCAWMKFTWLSWCGLWWGYVAEELLVEGCVCAGGEPRQATPAHGSGDFNGPCTRRRGRGNPYENAPVGEICSPSGHAAYLAGFSAGLAARQSVTASH